MSKMLHKVLFIWNPFREFLISSNRLIFVGVTRALTPPCAARFRARVPKSF